ncbi:hypothetical protein BZA05DRAFT_411275 [Tricharina praecox]|uniref:uncharacterized protein n=1 Tax=Tricharina praecox TaxID=43433 RepID=UPI00221FCF96|nr:uncharacterized protein BZA05DRAFT_411275 [Tricharina praecox]KAI5843151.1 hypothetical protein BZA05DRAFT_411275 [Tricharina praecox]
MMEPYTLSLRTWPSLLAVIHQPSVNISLLSTRKYSPCPSGHHSTIPVKIVHTLREDVSCSARALPTTNHTAKRPPSVPRCNAYLSTSFFSFGFSTFKCQPPLSPLYPPPLSVIRCRWRWRWRFRSVVSFRFDGPRKLPTRSPRIVRSVHASSGQLCISTTTTQHSQPARLLPLPPPLHRPPPHSPPPTPPVFAVPSFPMSPEISGLLNFLTEQEEVGAGQALIYNKSVASTTDSPPTSMHTIHTHPWNPWRSLSPSPSDESSHPNPTQPNPSTLPSTHTDTHTHKGT